MDETNRTTPPVPETPEVESSQRWLALMAFLTTWCLPATTAKRTNHVSLFDAFVVHLLSGVAASLLITLFVGIAEVAGPMGVGVALLVMCDAIGKFASEFAHRPWELGLATAAVVASIELGFVALALLITPWGAQDEPIRSSFTNGLRRTWLHTTHALVAVLLVGIPATTLSRMETAWNNAFYMPGPKPPQPPANVPQGSQARRDYDEALREYWAENWRWQTVRESKKPWYFRNIELFVANGCVLSAFWIVWALLRAVGTPRRGPPVVRPPTCEACGYNLTAIPMESRCPECGEPVILSLGPDIRPGTIWERRREVGRLVAWWRCCVDSFSQPKQFGRKIRIVAPGTDHRRFLAVHLPIVFLLSVVGISALIWIQTRMFGEPTIQKLVEFVLMPGSIVGCVGVLIALAIPMLVALLVGLWFYLQDKRNLLVGSMQVASYLAGYLTLWVAFAWVMLGVVIALDEARWLRAAETLTGIDQDILGFFTWLIPNLVCAVAYFGLVARGTAALRYANR